MSKTFKGHGTLALIYNVSLALIPIVYIKIVGLALWLNISPMVWIFSLFVLFTFPHPTYLFFEIKHLIHKPSLVGSRDATAVIVFGLLSLLGLGLQITTNVILLRLLNPTHLFVTVLILSLLASLGGCLGLTDLPFLLGLYPPLLYRHLMAVVSNKNLVVLCLGTSLLLLLLTLPFI